MKKLDPFYDYYQRELSYLRHSGQLFGQTYPKIASRLDLSAHPSSDPHVERLLESFAYLTARLQRDIDDLSPQLTQSLLRVLYPQFIQPLPAYTIAHFALESITHHVTSSLKVPKGTKLFGRSFQDQICRFRTCYDLEVAPVIVKNVQLGSAETFNIKETAYGRFLKISLEAKKETFQSLSLSSLRFYINGSLTHCHKLYEGIMKPEGEAWCLDDQGQPLFLGRNVIHPVGFHEDESILPYPDQAHPGYRLLLEYFYYPKKFLFVDVKAGGLAVPQTHLDLLIPFDTTEILREQDINKNDFLLGCVPVVNLFETTSEPLILDRRQTEYRLNPNLRQEITTEIYDIQEVLASFPGKPDVIRYKPYFDYRYKHVHEPGKTFWHMRRSICDRPGFTGTDVHISFVDLNFDPTIPANEIVFAKLLCTNRGLAPELTAKSALYTEDKWPFSKITCLEKPSRPLYPPSDGILQWQLISQLSLNHLGLTGGMDGLKAMKEFLYLYSILDQRHHPELDMIIGFDTQTVVRRFGVEAWRGFAQGTTIQLTLAPDKREETYGFMLAMVLNHVLPMFAALNSFTQLELYKTSQKKVWKKWTPRTGTRPLL